MSAFSRAFQGEEIEAPPEGKKGKKGKKGGFPPFPPFLPPRYQYKNAAAEPRCTSCSRWWRNPNRVWKTGEIFGDCLLHGIETLERDNCFGHSDWGRSP